MTDDIEKQFALVNSKINNLASFCVKTAAETKGELHKLKSENKALVRKAIDEEVGRLTKLRDDAVKVLRFLIGKGVISQEELNEVLNE